MDKIGRGEGGDTIVLLLLLLIVILSNMAPTSTTWISGKFDTPTL